MAVLSLLPVVAVLAGAPGANAHGNLVDETKYATLLSAYVKDARVDYPALKAHRDDLDAYLKQVAAVSKDDFDKAPKEARISYLVNAYNGYTLQSIIDNYPKPVKDGGGLFSTGNSIKQIKGVWNKNLHPTALGQVTLDNIEHDNLRKLYGEPRVHMALVCASKGCPPLRSEPYYADQLPAQLEDQARTYLASPYGLVMDGDKVKLSKIFDWFHGDFKVDPYGSNFGFVEKYAPADKVEKVKAAEKAGSIGWIDYDWTLNEQKTSS